jgi:hypothetical protein
MEPGKCFCRAWNRTPAVQSVTISTELYQLQPPYIENKLKISINGIDFLRNKYFVYSGLHTICDRLCGLVVRVLGYRSGGTSSIPGATRKKKIVGLERGPPSLVSTTEELLDRKVAAPV